MSAGAPAAQPRPAATLTGMAAVLMWSASIGLFRSVAEIFGPTGGAALIFTLSGAFASLALGVRVRGMPRAYLLVCGALFVAYEIALALSVGLARDRAQSLELGMINYLWPSLTVLFAVAARQQRGSWLLLPAVGLGQACVLGALTAAAYSCWNHGVQRGNITLLATASYFTPVLSMALASLWLGVRPGPGFLQGVLMVTAGSLVCWLATRSRR